MKKSTRVILSLLAAAILVCILVLFLAGCPVRTEPEPVYEAPVTEETVCLEDLIVLPDPYTWFSQGEKWAPEAGPYCSLSFAENPEPAVREYMDLLIREYGLAELPQEGLVPMGIVLGDEKTGERAVTITWAKLDNFVIGFLVFDFSEEYTTVPGPVWDGEVTEYAYHENDWSPCEICEGTGKCRECHGRGYVTEIDIDGFTDTVDCSLCEDGKCPNSHCRQGRIPKGR